MAINTSTNKVRIISTTVGLANSSKYTEINSPALVVNTSDGGIFYADGTAKNPFKQLAALPNHTHSGYATTTQLANYLPLSGGTISGNFSVKPTNIGYYQEGIRIYKSPSVWAGIAFGFNEGEDTLPKDGWWAAVNPSKEFVISAGGSDSCLGLRLIKDGDAKWRNNTIIHSGNIGQQTVASANNAAYLSTIRYAGDINANNLYSGATFVLRLSGINANLPSNMSYGNILYVGGGDTGFMLAGSYSHDKLLFRRGTNANNAEQSIITNAWKQIAFTSDIPTKVSQLTNDMGYTTATGHTHSYLPLSGGSLSGYLSSSSYLLGTGLIRVNAADKASNFGYIRAETASTAADSSNRGVVHIGSNYGGSSSISNSVSYDAIGIYRTCVGIGGTFTYATLKSNYDNSIKLDINGSARGTNFITTSDKRLKKNINEISSDKLSNSLNINFVEFDYVNNDNHSAGHIAQEVKEVLPEFVYGNESETEHLSIDYTGLHSVQIKALIDEINKLKEEIRNLKSSNIKLK